MRGGSDSMRGGSAACVRRTARGSSRSVGPKRLGERHQSRLVHGARHHHRHVVACEDQGTLAIARGERLPLLTAHGDGRTGLISRGGALDDVIEEALLWVSPTKSSSG